MKKQLKMAKKIKEGDDSLNLMVNKNDYEQNKDTLTNAVGEKGSVTITNKDNPGISEDQGQGVNGLSEIIQKLGINLKGQSPETAFKIKRILNDTINRLSEVGVNLSAGDDVSSLYSGADDRGIEYGIRSESKFDSLMEALNKKGVKTIDIKENVNPRIKKGDLIEYFKNKKNGR